MATRTSSSALRALAVEYKSLQEEPVEGFCVKLVNDDNLFEWEVAIFGPPDTLYMGGCFKVGARAKEKVNFSRKWKVRHVSGSTGRRTMRGMGGNVKCGG